MKPRFLIVGPQWIHKSAGVQVLYKLCHQLRQCGYDAYVAKPGNPNWDNPLMDTFDQANDIVVYPDIISDNPLGAKKVVRYLLYYPQDYFKKTTVKANELCIPYHKFLLPDCRRYCAYDIPDDYVTEIRVIEPELFFDDDEEKTLTSYWVGKGGQNYSFFNLPMDSVQITRTMTRYEVAKVLQKTKTFFCFDVNSAISDEAYLCGAEVFLVTERDSRVIQYRGVPWQENHDAYYDLERVKKFAELCLNFHY
jgi:hypothetical protein